MLDLPCGDREWMQHVDLTGITYIGGDIVPGLINTLQKQNHAETCTYQILDMIRGPLPSTEMILCRDGLVHLPFSQAMNAMNTFLNSNATWLLTTTFPQRLKNRSVDMPGEWSPYNLERAPFSLPPPQEMLVENCSEENGAFRDKALGLWRIKDLRS